MLQTIAEEISLRLVTNKVISIENRKYYTYGIELVLNNIVIFLSIGLIGFLTKRVFISLIYVVTYCSIRNYVGGYHCKTHINCYCTTLFLYLLMLFLNYYLSNNRLIVSYGLIAVAIPVIYIFTPVDYGIGSILDNDRKKYRVKSFMLIAIALAIYILANVLHQTEVSFAVAWAIFIVFSLMLLSLFINLSETRRKKNEE
ncbi:accessory gene regulator B family protein [Clostridium boliviensis]|uniref:Accessory gene regulator B family protein n=1 Tax=Clostridium boliviensis TaxID=318465 RepID=A0ABU4GSR1_9CLOT|nr:accessory gene regulator B family protein [Clostridium boliviensis]MDW2800680.1 accessory gene regulator B family protein [Clostridium boliviensis]